MEVTGIDRTCCPANPSTRVLAASGGRYRNCARKLGGSVFEMSGKG